MVSELVDLFPPMEDEFVVSYLMRLAERNRVGNWHDLVRMADTSVSRQSLWLNKKYLCEALGLEPTWLETVMPTGQNGVGLHSPEYLRSRTDAICPSCVKESPHGRLAWSHSFVSACPRHQLRLVDQCTHCSAPLRSERNQFDSCECGMRLAEMSAQKPTDLELWISASIQHDMTERQGMPRLASTDECDQLPSVLLLLASRADPHRKLRTSKVGKPKSIAAFIESIQPLEVIFSNWPEGMRGHVQMRLKEGPQNQSTLVGRLGPWYRGLARHCDDGRFNSIWNVVSDAIAEQFDGKMRGDGALRLSPGRSRTFISLNEASQRLQVSRSNLKAAVHRGDVSARIDYISALYSNIQLTVDEVARIEAERTKWLHMQAVLEMLNVPEAVLNALVKAGAIETEPNWRGNVLRPGAFSATSVFELIAKLESSIHRRPCEDTMALRDIIGRRSSDVSALLALYRRIVSGEVQPVGSDGSTGIGGLLFDKSEVTTALGSVTLDSALTLLQLQQITGWKYDSVSHWIDAGFIKSNAVKLRGQQARTVPMSAVVAFASRYMPLSTLAKQLKSKPASLLPVLQRLGVEPVGWHTTTEGTRRGMLVPLDDVFQILLGRNLAPAADCLSQKPS